MTDVKTGRMKTMMTANEARIVAMKNPTFERKTALYAEVSARIQKAAEEGKRHVHLTDEEHYALDKELREKGYNDGKNLFIITIAGLGGNTHPHRYEF